MSDSSFTRFYSYQNGSENWCFTGKPREDAGDLFGARFYQYHHARWFSPDPSMESGLVEYPTSWNRYQYCNLNPINTIDPDGEQAIVLQKPPEYYKKNREINASFEFSSRYDPNPLVRVGAKVFLFFFRRPETPKEFASEFLSYNMPGPAAIQSPANNVISGIANSASRQGAKALAKSGQTFVYRSIDPVTKAVQYVGITNDLARRAVEHLATKGIQIRKVMECITRADARAVEQALIEIHQLGKNGGTLLNKINSIASTNPEYAKQLQRGYDLLHQIGYN